MGLTQCSRCGGQISTNSTACQWCGHSTSFNLLGPLVLLILVLSGASFGFGLVHWTWLENLLGLDRGFVDQVVIDDQSTGGGGGGGDLGWRLPPAPDQAANYRGASGGGGGGQSRAVPAAATPPVSPARVLTVVRTSRSAAAPASPGSAAGCADSSAIGRLIAGYPKWSNSDLGLIACGRVRSGFSGDQVRASLGKPPRVERDGPTRERWVYPDLTVLVEQGRVISYGR